MEKSNNKLVILLLGIIIVILAVLCVLFATGTIAFNFNDKDNNEINNDKNQIINSANDTNTNKFIGVYSYKGELYDSEVNATENHNIDSNAWTDGKMAYEELKLGENGIAEATAGNVRAGGYNARGKWYISNNELIIINENCKAVSIDNEAIYPNCSPIWTYMYKNENGKIILSSNNNTMTKVDLNKIN